MRALRRTYHLKLVLGRAVSSGTTLRSVAKWAEARTLQGEVSGRHFVEICFKDEALWISPTGVARLTNWTSRSFN
jgi:hypothetical protein